MRQCLYRSRLFMFTLFLLMWMLAWSQIVLAGISYIRIKEEAGSFLFIDGKDDPSKPITVYTYPNG